MFHTVKINSPQVSFYTHSTYFFYICMSVQIGAEVQQHGKSLTEKKCMKVKIKV